MKQTSNPLSYRLRQVIDYKLLWILNFVVWSIMMINLTSHLHILHFSIMRCALPFKKWKKTLGINVSCEILMYLELTLYIWKKFADKAIYDLEVITQY